MPWAWNDPIEPGTDWTAAEFQTAFQQAYEEREAARRLGTTAAPSVCAPGTDIQLASRIATFQGVAASRWGANVPAASTAILHSNPDYGPGSVNIVRTFAEILTGVGIPDGRFTRKRPRTVAQGPTDDQGNPMATGQIAIVPSTGLLAVWQNGSWRYAPVLPTDASPGLWTQSADSPPKWILDTSLPAATKVRLGVEVAPGVWEVNPKIWHADVLDNHSPAPNAVKSSGQEAFGFCRVGDYLGHWIWQELMAVYNDLQVTVHEIEGWNTGDGWPNSDYGVIGETPYPTFRQWPTESPTAMYGVVASYSGGRDGTTEYASAADAIAAADRNWNGSPLPPSDVGYDGSPWVPGENAIGPMAMVWVTHTSPYPPYQYWVASKGSQRVSFECAVTNHVPCTVSLIYHAYVSGSATGPYGVGTFDNFGENVVQGIQLQDGPVDMNHTDRVRRRVIFAGGLAGKEPTTYGDLPGRGFYLNVAVVAHWSFSYHGPIG